MRMELFWNQWLNDNHAISLSKFFSNKSKMASCILKFRRCSVDRKTWCVFRVRPLFSNSSDEVWMGKHHFRGVCPKGKLEFKLLAQLHLCTGNAGNRSPIPLWCLNLIQVIYNRHLITRLLPCGICAVFCKLQEVTNDILKWYNVNLLTNQLVLIQSLLSDMTSSEIDTQLQVLEKNGFVDLVLPCTMFLAFDDIIQRIQSWLFLSNFDKL